MSRTDDYVATSVRIPRALADRLDDFCDERIVGRNYVVTKAVERLLDELEDIDPMGERSA